MHPLQSGLILAAGTLLLLLTLPLLLELLVVSVAAVLPRGRKGKEPRLGTIERLMVLIPAHHEQASIGACVRSIAASIAQSGHATSGPDDILVVAHNCTDGTAEIASAAGARVAVLDDPHLRGKGNALAHGFALAFGRYNADAVLVVDADSTVSPNLLASVRLALTRRHVVQTRYETQSALPSARGSLQALSFLAKNVVRAAGRQRLGLSCGLFGNGFALRREVLDRVPYAAHSIVEDLEFHLALIAVGIPTGFVHDALVLAEVPASTVGQRTQAARWEGGRVRMVLAQAPRLIRRIAAGQLALTEPLLDLLGLPIALQVLCLTFLLLLPPAFPRWYALAGILTLAFHLLVALRFSPAPRSTALALLQAPWYVLRKVALTPSILRMARKKAVWVKTSRAPAER